MALNQDAVFKISAEVTGQGAVDKLSDSLRRLGAQGEMSSKQIAAAMRMVPAQLTDIATQLAGGQSPFLIMMQQGGQLRDMFGSVTGALVGVARTIGTVVTPVNMVIAALGGVAYAAYKGRSEFDELTNKLTLTGNAAGYSAGQIEKMSRTLSDTAGISEGKARDLASALATSGQFVGRNMELAETAAARVQKLTGQTAEEVAKDFASMSRGVASWAAEHNRSYNYLTAAEFQHIKALEEMGNKEGAMRANMDALNKAFKDRKEQLGYIETAWKNITEWASKGWAAMLNLGKPQTDEDKLAGLKRELAKIESLANQPMTGGIGDADRMAARRDGEAKRAMILEQMRVLQQGIDKADKERLEKAEAMAKEREKIDEIQSGKLTALQNANLQLETERLKGASEKRIAIIEQEGQRVENQYRAGLITEEKYNVNKLDIAKRVLNERMKLAEQEMAVEQKRPTNSKADVVQRETRLQALRNELAKLDAEQTQAGLKAEGDRAEFLKKTNDELIKFTTTQQTRISQIISEAEAVDMSTLEYKKHTEGLRINKEAADAMVGKDEEAKQKILAQAEAFKEATNAALDYAEAKSKSFTTGVQTAMKEYIETTANAANQAKNLFTNAFKGMEDAMVNFVKTGKLDFASLADSIISDLIRMTIQAQITGPLMQALKGMTSPMSWFSANGNVMTQDGPMPLNTYANGGIANRPQVSIFGEGKTPEAYVPLPDGRTIPVTMQGGGGANVTVNVVNNASGAQARTQERQDSQGNRVIDVMIEQVKASIAGDIARGVGTIPSALERTYGANRTAGAY